MRAKLNVLLSGRWYHIIILIAQVTTGVPLLQTLHHIHRVSSVRKVEHRIFVVCFCLGQRLRCLKIIVKLIHKYSLR